ncbi:uncharacterized protein MEPE_05297 [Melanopsichium pennsylvanicum]|uniref:Uncharacterized protein n=2 Tax=Melanopsichium pennsylvanicum TaxID=63383 RepID=A0AAJ4XT23_9BASI|nr:conserved hypothetical protein [Melanopsichium pennsylvanicum 4]SNX86588.1 uncharacterized protein MEPE_05297 [Melanopsichium pennsylvanicum]
MPICALHLVQLANVSPDGIDTFLQNLLGTASKDPSSFDIITVSRVQSPIIRPTLVDQKILNNTPWTLLLVTSGTSAHSLPFSLTSSIQTRYSLVSGIPGKIVSNYDRISGQLRKDASSVPLFEIKLDDKGDVIPPKKASESLAQTRADGQDLSLSPALLDLAKHLNHKVNHHGPVSMLNLLHFHTTPEAVESYHEYGRRFETVAGKRGGNAKLVGIVISPLKAEYTDSRGDQARKRQDWWNECTLVHYPSINHFIDMSVDNEYQYINKEYRLSAIKDTALICTTEVDLNKYRSQPKL